MASPNRICSIEGCVRPHDARGWCKAHYKRWQRNGDPNVLTLPLGRTPVQRFWEFVSVASDGCWHWTGAKNHQGYGKFWSGEAFVFAHRWAYEYFVAPIPNGLMLDHVCHSRLSENECAGGPSCTHRPCVNPRHLEPVTNHENCLRSLSSACRHGHEYTPKNTLFRYLRGTKIGRVCRTCRSAQNKRYKARRRARTARLK